MMQWPALLPPLSLGYAMIGWPVFGIPVALGWTGRYRRMQQFTLAFAPLPPTQTVFAPFFALS